MRDFKGVVERNSNGFYLSGNPTHQDLAPDFTFGGHGDFSILAHQSAM
jgi:hypothetical protein